MIHDLFPELFKAQTWKMNHMKEETKKLNNTQTFIKSLSKYFKEQFSFNRLFVFRVALHN